MVDRKLLSKKIDQINKSLTMIERYQYLSSKEFLASS